MRNKISNFIARMLLGNLRHVDEEVCARMKAELRNFHAKKKVWDSPNVKKQAESEAE